MPTDVVMVELVESLRKWDFMGQTVTETVQLISGLLLRKITSFGTVPRSGKCLGALPHCS